MSRPPEVPLAVLFSLDSASGRLLTTPTFDPGSLIQLPPDFPVLCGFQVD
jgi:hypothetical protein